jgi:hypothetical protein
MRHKVGAGVLALAGAVTPPAARGAPSIAVPRSARSVSVLEAHVGQRPADATTVLAPLFDELDARGFVSRPAAVIERLGGRAPRPGVLDPERSAADIAQLADIGYEAYTRGRFAEAEAALQLASSQVHRNPALLVLDTTNLNVAFKILVGLALSQAKRGDARASVATIVELIRTFRSQPIMRTDYGPEAERLYRAVWKQLQPLERGQLTITADHEQAVIFVDGQIRGLGRARLTDLLPGLYRVYVQVPATLGRQYEVVVAANAAATLHIDWELDAAIWATDTWLGLLFATEAERARLPDLLGRMARGWGGEEPVAVVGITQVGGKQRVTATLYASSGEVVRAAEVILDGTIPGGSAPGGGASAWPGGEHVATAALLGAGNPRPRGQEVAVAGSAMDSGDRGDPGPPGSDDLALRSLARFLDDGTLAVGVSVVRAPVAPAAVVPVARSRVVPTLLVSAGAAALVAGGVLYAIDQDPAMTRTYLYRNTTPAAVAVGSVGLTAMCVGFWLWTARGGRSSGPTLAIGHSGAVLGWTGEL